MLFSTDPTLQVVKEQYTNQEGLIHAYPLQQDSEYLSESIGLYMEYLVLVKDEERFSEQYEILMNNYQIQQGDLIFIQWVLKMNTKANALIDDVRIISALHDASTLFEEPKYAESANQLTLAITSNQKSNGYTVDFYDWSLNMPAKRITLSYLTNEFFQSTTDTDNMKDLLKNLDDTTVFFPEYFDVTKRKYRESEEVHMIDQLLIAINRENIGYPSEIFKTWCLNEWKHEGKIYGRYDRQTKTASVTYESLAVYYYLNTYFQKINEPDLAKEVLEHAELLASESTIGEAHFFDYIHFQLMKKNME
ncbi:hypothetical protein KR50_35320 [Jeotgalibacillus campisalis]|uniref:Uncharacterized protein n=1 Tax=Jeotgalibacillus campisalis TaxID=220754 RepID=A0A0C2RMY2_9BACL|nr:hypothetical protein KR50_35320 [Jeotgalibacillus campisalis]